MPDEIEELRRQLDEAAPWLMFYRDGLTLGDIAVATNKSIYDFSPWLYAPLTRAVLQATEGVGELKAVIKDALPYIEHEAYRDSKAARIAARMREAIKEKGKYDTRA